MDGLVAIIIWAFIIIYVIVKLKAGKKKAAKRTTTIETIVREAAAKKSGTPRQVAEQVMKEIGKEKTPVKPVTYRTRTLASAGIHDDRNDWLAGQLAEERKSEQLMSAMFGLKLKHALDCPAEKLRDEHAASCDAEEVRRYSRK